MIESPENSHSDGFTDGKSWMKCVSDPSEKIRKNLGSERQNMVNDWPKVLILPEVPPKNFFDHQQE